MRQLTPICLAAALAAPLAASAEAPSPVRTAELSARLYDAGLAARDPLLVIAAASLRKQIAPEPGARQAEGAAPEPGAPLGWQDMLATAEELAAGDEALLGVAGDVRGHAFKGVASGPVYNISALSSGRTDSYPAERFVGGEYAEVYVEAKSTTDMNLRIYDDKGRLVCSDTDRSHIAYCGWTPQSDGDFVMKVENNGPAAATYSLMTN